MLPTRETPFLMITIKVRDMKRRCTVYAQKTKRYAKFQQSGNIHATQGKIRR
jgi:hypothetical protein